MNIKFSLIKFHRIAKQFGLQLVAPRDFDTGFPSNHLITLLSWFSAKSTSRIDGKFSGTTVNQGLFHFKGGYVGVPS